MKRRLNIIIFMSGVLILTMPVAGIGQVPCLSGFVRNEGGQAVFDADLDFDNAITGQRIYTPNDNTDEMGFYRVCILAGTYHVSYAPPAGTHLLGKRIFNLVLNQSMPLDVTLGSGYVISGSVHDSTGQPVAGIDLDVDSLGGGRVYTPNDNTDSSGAYWLVAPPGTYRLRLSPPAGSRYREIEINPLAISGDTTIDLTMSTGHILSGRVTGTGGAGIDSIIIDVRDHLTGQKIFVPNNETDSLGSYHVVLPSGIFDVRFAPPFASRYVAIQVDSVTMQADLSLNRALSPGFLVNVSVTDTAGNPVADADLDFSIGSTGQRIFTPFDKTDSAGNTIVSLPSEVYTVRADPPMGSILDRLTLLGVAINSDTSLQLALREVDRVSFGGRLVNESGAGLGGIILKLRSFPTSPEIPLSRNVSDSLGRFDFDVPIGRFMVFIIPPRGSHRLAIYYENVIFSQDTLWGDVVIDSGALFSATVFDHEGRPQAGVEFTFMPDSTEETIYTANNITDQSGTAQIAVPPQGYRIEIRPPAGSDLRSRNFTGIEIRNDTSMTIVLTDRDRPLPSDFKLAQNYPNPFNNATTIKFFMIVKSEVTLSIYNTVGQKIRMLKLGQRDPGPYLVKWDGRDSQGSPVASGVYFYELRTAAAVESKKMIFIK